MKVQTADISAEEEKEREILEQYPNKTCIEGQTVLETQMALKEITVTEQKYE